MKRDVGKKLLIALIVVAVVVLLTLAQRRNGSQSGQRQYNPAVEVELTGTVQEIQTRTSPRGRLGTHFIVHAENKVIDVHIGPTSFVQDQPISFSAGDEVEIIGAKSGNGDSVIARQIMKDGKLLTLRNAQGIPVWSRNSPR